MVSGIFQTLRAACPCEIKWCDVDHERRATITGITKEKGTNWTLLALSITEIRVHRSDEWVPAPEEVEDGSATMRLSWEHVLKSFRNKNGVFSFKLPIVGIMHIYPHGHPSNVMVK